MTHRASLRTILATARAIRVNPEIRVKTGLWDQPYWTAAEFRRWFLSCLQRKINAADPRFPLGRKAGEEYQIELLRLRNYIGNRVIRDWIAPCLGQRVRARLAHRLRCNLDYP